MLDAICILSKGHQPTKHYQTAEGEVKAQTIFSIFEFKLLPTEQIEQYRHALYCPECLQVAYFRRASKDGKQACFGSRYHLAGCSELNTHSRDKNIVSESKLLQSEHVLVESKGNQLPQVVVAPDADSVASLDKSKKLKLSEQGFTIDFTAKRIIKSKPLLADIKKIESSTANKSNNTDREHSVLKQSEQTDKPVTQTLSALLKSLFKKSSLATSDVWVHTSEKHRWRAKNLFVHFRDAEQLEKVAPRMYWGNISHSDSQLLWLNVADNKQLSIPISHFKEELLSRYEITQAEDLKGAKIILFAKCLNNKQKSRQFLTLWDNDLQYLHLVLTKPNTVS